PSRPAAAKTGTTDDFRDSWVIGYTPDLLTGVWVGNSDGSPMRDVFGAQGAGCIYHAFMETALAGQPPRPFPRPPGIVERDVCARSGLLNDPGRPRVRSRPLAGIVERDVCALSGLLPSPDCPQRVTELFTPSTVPTKQDDFFKKAEVCRINGKLANEFVPANAREVRVFVTFPDPYKPWAAQH